MGIFDQLRARLFGGSDSDEAASAQLEDFIKSARAATLSYNKVLATPVGEVSEDDFNKARDWNYQVGQIVATGGIRLPVGAAYLPVHFLINIAYLELKHLADRGDSLPHLRGAAIALQKLEKKNPFPHSGLGRLVHSFEGIYNSFLSVLGAIVGHPENDQNRGKDAQDLADSIIKFRNSYPLTELVFNATTAVFFLLDQIRGSRGTYLPYKVVTQLMPRVESEWNDLEQNMQSLNNGPETLTDFLDLSLIALCNYHEQETAKELFDRIQLSNLRRESELAQGGAMLKVLRIQRPDLIQACPPHFFE